MSKLSKALKAIGVHNTHGLLIHFGDAGRDVAVQFRGAALGRGAQVAGTRVWSPTFKTKPDAAWYHYGSKFFVGSRAETFDKALMWAIEAYEIHEWATCPMLGGRIPAYVLERAKKAIKVHS